MRFKCVHTINVLRKLIKINQIFPVKFSIFNAEKILCILHVHVFVMLGTYKTHETSSPRAIITHLRVNKYKVVRVFTIYGPGGHLGHVTWKPYLHQQNSSSE